jgi:hypothetical protein
MPSSLPLPLLQYQYEKAAADYLHSLQRQLAELRQQLEERDRQLLQEQQARRAAEEELARLRAERKRGQP